MSCILQIKTLLNPFCQLWMTDMITAAAHGKDRSIQRLCEDEITSSVFGPLAFLPTDQIWTLFRKLLPIEDLCPSQTPDQARFSFWKRLAVSRIEPDLLVCFLKDEQPLLTVLVEVKWKSGLSSEDQLVDQWANIPEDERGRCLHLYLVRNETKGQNDIEQSLERGQSKGRFPVDQWKERLFCLGWRKLADILQVNQFLWKPPLALWATNVVSFMQRSKLTSFTGFGWLGGFNISSDWSLPMIWTIPPWFSYLQGNTAIPAPPNGQPLFWRS